MTKKATVINIQKYSINDGEGIRTTVFFKGCPLRCIWCHNPESWRFESQLLYNTEKCTLCQRCFDKCPINAICVKDGRAVHDLSKCRACGACVEACLSGAKEVCGREYSVSELIAEILKDTAFYEQSGGGVTLSGGEVMSQDIEFLTELVKSCHKLRISINIDTCGFAQYNKFKAILPYVDTFLYDIKIMDAKLHKLYTGEDNSLILENLKKLSNDGAKINVRIPLIDGINCDDENINAIIDFLGQIKVDAVTLLPYHTIGIAKYERVGLSYSGLSMEKPDKSTLLHIRDLFADNHFNVNCENLN